MKNDVKNTIRIILKFPSGLVNTTHSSFKGIPKNCDFIGELDFFLWYNKYIIPIVISHTKINIIIKKENFKPLQQMFLKYILLFFLNIWIV